MKHLCAESPPFAATVQAWDTTASGEAVVRVELSHDSGTKMVFSNYGATWLEAHVPDRHGKIADVVLGFDDLASYETRNPMFGSVIGRLSNRLAKAQFQLNGKTIHLQKNFGEHQIHGGSPSFAHRVWTFETQASTDAAEVTFHYLSPDGENGFPGTLKTSVTYRLSQGGKLTIHYRASTDQDTVVNLTNHAYFNLAGHDHGDIQQHLLKIFSTQGLEYGNQLIPTGRTLDVSGGLLDFTTSKSFGTLLNPMHDELKATRGLDHYFFRSESPVIAEVIEPNSGRGLRVSTTQPGAQFYTGNHLDLKSSKNGAHYLPLSGFCVETQAPPDAPNHDTFPSVLVTPTRPYAETAVFEFFYILP